MRKKSPTRESLKEMAERAAARAPTVRRLILDAYDAGKRDLPWRGETDPYRIWVSEVMLQQTRVDTVIPYYGRWLERFPDIEALAAAEEDDVLRAWQGLGYYSRARRLQAGARVVRERFGGSLPGDSEGLRGLPGVGDYTAGAVASIAFGEVVPAVDGNVKRVLARLFDLPDPSPGELRALAGELVDRARPGDFNQALMELGALICGPRGPRCGECPLGPLCLSLENGTVEERPRRRSKRPVPQVDVAVVVAVARDELGEIHLLLRKRPDTGLLAGMWEFPGVEMGKGEDSVRNRAWLRTPAAWARFAALETVTHQFSHLKARYLPMLYRLGRPGDPGVDFAGCRWVSRKELDEIPLPVAQGKIAKAALKAMDG